MPDKKNKKETAAVKKPAEEKSTTSKVKFSKEDAKSFKAFYDLVEQNKKREYDSTLKQYDLEEELYTLRKSATKETFAAADAQKDYSKLVEAEFKLEQKKLDILESGGKLDEIAYKNIKKEIQLQQKGAKLVVSQFATYKKINKLEREKAPLLKAAADAQNKLTEAQAKFSQGVESSLSFLDDIDSALNDIPIVGGILSAALGLDDIKKQASAAIIDMFGGSNKAAKTAAEKKLKEKQKEIDDITKIEEEYKINEKKRSKEIADNVADYSIEVSAKAAKQKAETNIRELKDSCECETPSETPSETSMPTPEAASETSMPTPEAAPNSDQLSLFDAEEAVEASKEVETSVIDTKAAIEEARAAVGELKNEFSAASWETSNIKNEVKQATEAEKEAGAAAEEMKEGLKKSESAAGKLMTALGPVALIAAAIGAAVMLFKIGLEVDQEVTDMARGLGISKDNAHELRNEIKDIAINTKIAGADTKALTEAYMSLTAITGQNTVANKEMLETNVLLTKQYGMQATEAAEFQLMSVGSGKTSEQVLGTVRNMTESYNKMTGDSLNFKEITKDIAKATKSQLASYKGNVAQLTKAVIQAKKLGMTLDEAANISANLLDFESSIENEMKANVLTGKSMNMNAARQLALQGDIAGAAAAALEQAGSYDEFMEMEMYQKEAIAKAAGTTVDQLVKSGQLQKMSVALGGKEIKNMSELTEADRQALVASGDLNEDEAAKLAIQEQQVSQQEKMTQAIDKIKEAFLKIMDGPLGAIVDAFSTILGNAAVMKGIITAIAIAAIPFAVSMAAAAISAIGTMSALTLGVGALAAVAGIAVTVAAMNSETDKAKKDATAVKPQEDAHIAPDGGLMVSGEKGTYQLHKDDSVIAGTDLGSISNPPMNDSNTTSSTPNNSNNGSSEVVSLLKELIKKIDQPVQFNIGGKTIQEIDKIIAMNRSYSSSDNNYAG